VTGMDVDARLTQRLAALGIRLVDTTDEFLVAECVACRTHWEIASGSLGLPQEDESADWWWCPNGCNRTE